MICVDTSVWIAALRHHGGPEAHHLGELLDADEVLLSIIVKLELLAGARPKDQTVLRDLLTALPQAVPDGKTWGRIDRWLEVAVGRREHFGIADLMIAAAAADHAAPVWSLDSDFARMEKLGLVARYPAP